MTKRYIVNRNVEDGMWWVVDIAEGRHLRYHIESSANHMASYLNSAHEADWVLTEIASAHEVITRLESEHLPYLDRLGGDWNQMARDIRDILDKLRQSFEK